MHHAVQVGAEAHEQAELGDAAHFAFDFRTDGVLGKERAPRIVHGLLEAKRDTALVAVHVQHFHIDFLRGRENLAGVHVLLGPAHFGDVDQAFDTIFQFHERAVVGDVGDDTLQACARRVTGRDIAPRIGAQLFHAERDTLGLGVDLDDLDFDFLADFDHLRGVVYALVGHVGDVQQAVDSAEVNERTVIGDVLDDAFADIAFLHVGDDFSALFGAALFEDGAARDNDVAADAVELENGKRLHFAHQRANIAHRADVNLRTGKEGVDAAEVDREAALDAAGDGAFDGLALGEAALELDPALFTAGFLATENGLAEGVLDPVEVDIDDVAGGRLFVLEGKFLDINPAFGLQADVDDDRVIVDAKDCGRDNLAFLHGAGGGRGLEHRGEVGGSGVH